MSSWLRMSWKHPARRRVMSILRSAAPSRTAPESEVIEPPSNAATTGRPSTGGNAKSSELHSVCIGAPYGFEKSRVGNRFLSDSQPRCTCFGEKSALGLILYSAVPYTGGISNVALFVVCFCVIISMYGGGFSTVPAYLRDMFGTRYVGAIHGLLLTAWSMAGIFGPVLVNYIREYNVTHGVPKAQAYNVTMYIMAGLL